MANCENLNIVGIPRDCEANVGGIKKVWMTIWSNDIFTAASGETLDEESIASIKSGITWSAFEFRKGSSSMNSTLNVDETNGINYVQTDLSLVFAKMDTVKRTAVAALGVASVACIVLDSNGKYWALGFDEPVASTAGTGETGTARGDANHYTITLTDISRSYPMEIPANTPNLPSN